MIEEEESDEDWDHENYENEEGEQNEADFDEEMNLAEDTEEPKAGKPAKVKHNRPGRPRKNANPKT